MKNFNHIVTVDSYLNNDNINNNYEKMQYLKDIHDKILNYFKENDINYVNSAIMRKWKDNDNNDVSPTICVNFLKDDDENMICVKLTDLGEKIKTKLKFEANIHIDDGKSDANLEFRKIKI